jgi:predicted glycogen debranching enzyme
MLSHSNLYANTKYSKAPKGISIKLYDGYPSLHMQFSKNQEYIHTPDWYYAIEYLKERNRGYESSEDLFVPGYFEVDIKKGESIVFSAATFETKPEELKKLFTREIKNKIPRNSFFNCLRNSAEQFIISIPSLTDIRAGYPWYNGRTNQTFVALPGISLALNNPGLAGKIIDTNISRIKNGLFPQKWGRFVVDYDAADTPLWFFWTIQQLVDELGGAKEVWKKYKPVFCQILESFQQGTDFNIRMLDNGLISADCTGVALTWMNAYAGGKPVTPRYGSPVEINALWYNAICFALELARESKDKTFTGKWKELPDKVAISFLSTFWSNEKGYLADCSYNGITDWSIRPNQVIAAALTYSPLSKEMKKSVLSLAKKYLLTPRGLRTLSPNSEHFRGSYDGNEQEREEAIHQGSILPWLTGFFIEAYLKVHQRGGLSFVKTIMEGFEEEMTQHCIGTISELYNGNPPHEGKGAISQAWNIGELIRAYHLIDGYESLTEDRNLTK